MVLERGSASKVVLFESMSKFKKICVFCGSNSGNRDVFSDAALDLGNEMVRNLYCFSSVF